MTISAKSLVLVKQIVENKLHVRIRSDRETFADMCADGIDLMELSEEIEKAFNLEEGILFLTVDMTFKECLNLVNGAIKE